MGVNRKKRANAPTDLVPLEAALRDAFLSSSQMSVARMTSMRAREMPTCRYCQAKIHPAFAAILTEKTQPSDAVHSEAGFLPKAPTTITIE